VADIPAFDAVSAFRAPVRHGRRAGVIAREISDRGLATDVARRGAAGAVLAQLKQDYRVEVRAGACHAAIGGVTVIGTGPFSWLITREGAAHALAEELGARLRELAAVTDQTDGYAVVEVRGPRVYDALAKGVTIDLHPSAFGTGDAAVTSIAHMGSIIWQPDPAPVFCIAVFRSMADSLLHWLEASSLEFGFAFSPATS
jgi:sarcosine oxidase subunit gamma